MIYNSHQIANYFIKASQATGMELTPMKLIKLTYIAHAWCLGLYNEQLLDEVIYAWKYGPVIDTIYQDFRKYGNAQIGQLYQDAKNTYPLPDANIFPFLDTIWNVYGKYNGVQLSAMTHEPGTPWDIVWNNQGGKEKSYAIIPNDLIKSHCLDKIKQANARTINASATAPAYS